MPISLNPSDATSQPNTTDAGKRRVKTTNQMVDDALIELHSVKGVTLKQICSFILDTYNLDSISRARTVLIKKHILTLRESEDIKNKTGRGFSGRLKLVDKPQFIKKIKTKLKLERDRINAAKKLARETKQIKKIESNRKVNTKTKNAVKAKVHKRNFKKQLINSDIVLVVPRQVTPPFLRNNNLSMFDTPMVGRHVHASTPFISAAHVPNAPDVTHRVNRRRVTEEECGTPRSSLPGKKRRLLNRPE